MSTSTVSSKGQIVIPAAVRADMAVEPGTRVAFVKTPEGWLLKPATRPITDLKGLVKSKPAKPVSVEDMDLAIRRQAKRLFHVAMIGLDTNVLVRYIAQDDPRQSAQAGRLIEALSVDEPGYVSMVALAELVWVLDDVYGMTRDELYDVVQKLLETDSMVVQSSPLVWQALNDFRASSAGFADHLIQRVGSAAGCAETLTFDRKAARSSGMRLVAAS